jgi:inhibitor of KinA sporulation pathway (predicted exonuclease)
MSDDAEKWDEIYQKALIELGHAKVRGRIGDARAQIRTRVEKLKDLPGLHAAEHQAIDDALNALRFLEREEDRYDENQRRETLDVVATKIQSLGPKIKKLLDSASE